MSVAAPKTVRLTVFGLNDIKGNIGFDEVGEGLKNVVIGTAGHVDHGKTLLIKALTGIDTDRLKEEKKRGITIELGFAFIDFPNGERAGIVDVPGHEKFIKNMLAGAGGIDLAMLVVAADEGFMPQTVEHLGILTLLGIEAGLIVITKCDLVEPDWVDMIRDDVAEHVKGTFLEGAPVMAVSAYTGQGIPELRELLQTMVTEAGAKNTRSPFRVPVDRVFSVEGFGTVITGTLIEGQLTEGDEVTLYPSELSTKVRNLQVHGRDVEHAYAGQRVAVNLAGLKKTQVDRGDVVAKPGSMKNSLMLDARLQALPESERVIQTGMQVHLYHGARTLLCKVVLLDREELAPGESCYAQLRLTEPLAAKMGDRFVIRFYSPLETIGGGVILDPNPQRHKRGDQAALAALEVRESGSDTGLVLQALEKGCAAFQTWQAVAKTLDLPQDTLDGALAELTERGEIVEYVPGRWLTRKALDAYGAKVTALLSQYHGQNPLLVGMRREEARQKLFGKLDPASGDAILALLEQDGHFALVHQRLAQPGFAPSYSPKQKKILEQLETAYREGGLTPPDLDELYKQFPKDRDGCRQVLEAMQADDKLVAVTPQTCFSREAYDEAYRRMQEHFSKEETLTLGQFRDLLQASRKYAMALLEYWDRNKVTSKVGDERILLKK